MSDVLTHRNLPMLLLRARESVMRYFRKNLKEFGVTEQQWRVIRVLSDFGELETGKIAEEACILAPSLSGVLDRMETADLIVRHRFSSDQRKVFVDMTPKSRQLFKDLSGMVEKEYEHLEKLVGVEALSALTGLLDQLITLPEPAGTQTQVVREKLPARRPKRVA
jgi:homoprotocatechuate degradation regulator HpaR